MWTADKIIYNGIDTYIKAYQGSTLVWEKNITPEDPADDITLPYVTFRAEEAGSEIALARSASEQTMEYSTDKVNWYWMDINTVITLSNIGDEVYIRGKLYSPPNTNYTQFSMTGKIAAYGNCNALWNYEDLNAPLKERCGCSLFDGCTSLTKAPDLPATTLAKSCYEFMFGLCTSLTKAPDLPATTLAEGCYRGIFDKCTALTKAPKLPATTLADFCYQYMFFDCTSLTVAPELPVTTLKRYCYSEMFRGCIALTEAPELTAATLADYCYDAMFHSCTSLTKAPKLSATTLTTGCYGYMFHKCTSLQEITCLATDISASGCLTSWVYNVPSVGTFYKAPGIEWPTGASGIPEGWTVLDYTA